MNSKANKLQAKSSIDQSKFFIYYYYYNLILIKSIKNQKIFSKRSDIDSRLMELQAKIDLVKAFQNMPAGHGKFDFDKM